MKEIEVNKNIVIKDLLDETILLNLDNGEYYSLNSTGLKVWQFLEQKKTKSEIIQLLEEDYPDDSIAIKSDIETILQELQKQKLIYVS